MSKSIPQDVEDFLYDLGTRRDSVPGAFEEYAKTAAALLWEKYCIFQDHSIQIMPSPKEWITSSERRKQMKYTIVFILGKALSLMLLGLAYLMLRRSFRTWYR
jgi:hypothetical protein